MKVLMFGWEFPPHISGGLGTACLGLTTAMANEAINILFVVPKVFGDEPIGKSSLIGASDISISTKSEYYCHYEQNIRTIAVNSLLSPYLSALSYKQKYDNEITNSVDTVHVKFNFSGTYGESLLEEVERYALVATKISRTAEFDIIHCHDWLTYKAGIAASAISGKPLVIHVHATEFDRSGENVNQHVYAIEKAGMEAANCVITVSDFTASIVHERYGVPKNKIRTVHNGVDFKARETNDKKIDQIKEHFITFLGRITSQKGPSYFIDAASKILEKDKSFRFVMAGSGDLLESIIQKVNDLDLSSFFLFPGFVKGDEVQKVYAQSDVFVMPSVSEPFGIVPLEAMKQGVPVVISKQSGVSEVIKHAIKVDFWDVDALADAIYGLIKYPGVSKVMKGNAVEEVDTISWKKAAKKVKIVYESLIR